MIGVSEGKDQEARAILELAGIDSDKYRIWHHNSIYVHAINEETKESVIVEKATLEVLWRAIRDLKNNNTAQL